MFLSAAKYILNNSCPVSSCPTCSRMDETTPPERAKSTLAIGINLAALLKKGDDCRKLVLPSLPKLAQRTEEKEELVCGTGALVVGFRRVYSPVGEGR